jgi:hypothetical protein
MNAVTHALDARSLTNWFWQHGTRRSKYAISANWVSQLYDSTELLEVAQAVEERTRGGVAIWGPSQAGKSTLLSAFLDGDQGGSAINWSTDHPFRFSRSEERFPDTPALNPFNLRSDASGCVTCFSLRESVADPVHPVTITLSTRQGLMQAVAAGYLTECVVETEADKEVVWEPDAVLALLPVPQAVPTLKRNAFELARDLSVTIERLIADGTRRYRWLAREDAWNNQVRNALMHSAFDLDLVEALVRRLLWDDASGLNGLFSDLDKARLQYEGWFGGRSLHCSLEFASLLLDIATFKTLSGLDVVLDTPEHQRQQQLRARVLATRYEQRGDSILIGNQGTLLFGDEYAFGLFQGLVWAIEVPLNAAYIRASSQTLTQLLERADLYDVPGVAREEDGRPQEMLNAGAGGADRADLLSKVVKRGKTASIITRFARERRIDGVLLLVKGGEYPSKPRQLISGIETIWNGLRPTRHQPDVPPAPTFLCLTFMATFINEAAHGGFPASGLTEIGEKLARLGPLADPRMVDTFVTTYPQYPAGKILVDQRTCESLLDTITRDAWFRRQFPAGSGTHSFRSMLFDVDGGVGYLLAAMAEKMGEPASRGFVQETVQREASRIDQLIADAMPFHEGGLNETRQALDALAWGIRRLLSAPIDQDDVLVDHDRSYRASELVRSLSEVRWEELEPLPTSRTNVPNLGAYLERQKRVWREMPSVRKALAQAGLTPTQSALVLDAFCDSIDVAALAIWLFGLLPAQTMHRDAEHFRTYVATAMTNDLLGGDSFAESQESLPLEVQGFMQTLQLRFDRWMLGTEEAGSPHYDMIVRPFVRRIGRVAAAVQARDWTPQPGDDEIKALARRRPGLVRADAQGTP